MNTNAAMELAQDALVWIASDKDLLGSFLASTGATPAQVSAGAADPVFLGFLLDFLLADDARVIGFATAAEVPPERVALARAALPGGGITNWT